MSDPACSPAAAPTAAAPSGFREEGNEEFRRGNYLKAAAAYTKAMKEDPKSAALYSNRSAALAKLNKLPKALADAEEAIKLAPDWDKGYFRKGAALEALGRLEEALEAYQRAAEAGNGTNKQTQDKVRALQKLVRQQQQRQQKNGGGRGEGAIASA